MLRFRDCDGKSVTRVDMQHDVNIGTAVAHIDDMVRPNLLLGLQLIKDGNLTVPGGSVSNGGNLAAVGVEKLRPKDVVAGDNSFQCRVNHFNRRGGKVVLSPANAAYEPMVFDGSTSDEVTIFGKVVTVVRQLN